MITLGDCATVIVTYKREQLLKRVIENVKNQSIGCSKLYVVDNGNELSVKRIVLENGGTYLEGNEKAGGAGGYSKGMRRAVSDGYSYVWTLDDDGFPDLNCLRELVDSLTECQMQMITPISISDSNYCETANPYLVGLRKINDVTFFEAKHIWLQVSQLFNGMLISSELIERIGYPYELLFIRGDELDYLERIKISGAKFGMSSKARYFHPSSDGEFADRNPTHFLSVVLPSDHKKLYYQIRNRGYLQREHHLIAMLLFDWVKYPLHFMTHKKGTNLNFVAWFRIWLLGYRRKLISYEEFLKANSN